MPTPPERERERERRVSHADASYNGPATSATTLDHVIPNRKHAKNNPSLKTTRSLSQGPRQNRLDSTTKTDPNPTLCHVGTHADRRHMASYNLCAVRCQAPSGGQQADCPSTPSPARALSRPARPRPRRRRARETRSRRAPARAGWWRSCPATCARMAARRSSRACRRRSSR